MSGTYLAHHGILGQKWGVRRYQNRDGTLTSLGRKKLGVKTDSSGRVAAADRDQVESKIHGAVASDYRNIGAIASMGSNAARTAKQVSDAQASKARKETMKKMDVSELTNQQLQETINRMNLERTYKSLMTEDIADGQRRVSDFLETFGTVVSIGSNIAGIAATIHELKK